jgi:hypothetical protein
MKILDQLLTNNYAIYNGDCCDVLTALPTNSLDYSIFSPPFADLYTYSNSPRDLSNVKNDAEFFEQFKYMAEQLYRAIKPGRLISFHIINLPTSKFKDGFTGIKDFRGDAIRLFQSVGFIYHSEVCIWKDPGIAMQRTKAQGLLHKQLCKDSAMSRQALADYLVTMRKPGVNTEPIAGGLTSYAGERDNPTSPNTPEKGRLNAYSIEVWNRYASPVWMDINPSNTLQRAGAREAEDEKHITPTQLQVIERAMQLWTNPNDIVFSPFMGIGSEGYVALQMGRKFVGAELKESYYQSSKLNLDRALNSFQQDLFLEVN